MSWTFEFWRLRKLKSHKSKKEKTPKSTQRYRKESAMFISKPTLYLAFFITKVLGQTNLRRNAIEPNPTPLKQREIAANVKERPPIAELPDATIELARFYDTDVDIRFDREIGAYLVEKKFTLEEHKEPPGIASDVLNRDLLKDPVFTENYLYSQLEGFLPDHLALTIDPEFIESKTTDIAPGNDIPINVFAPDTRYAFRDTSYPWCTVGRVETSAGICTGTMVGRRLMLTAGHCVDWNENGAGWLKFTPSYYDGDAPFGVAWATRIIYWTQVDGSDGLSDSETAFDYVVLVLDQNMGDLTGYTGYKTYSSSWNNGNYWQNIGYPGRMTGTQKPAFSGGGAITSVGSHSTSGQTGYVLGNFIDMEGGHSGGPLWGWWSGESFPRVVGDMSAESGSPAYSTSGDNEAGGGPALSALISWARTNYP
jgi:V8-like Glu-specific endopeptidase